MSNTLTATDQCGRRATVITTPDGSDFVGVEYGDVLPPERRAPIFDSGLACDAPAEESADASQIKPNNYPQPGPIGNTQGIIVPRTQPAPAGASSDPEITFETAEEQDIAQWLSEQLGDMAEGAKPYAESYLDNVSETAHGFADQAMDVGGSIAMAGGVVAGAGAAAGATVIGAPIAAVLVPVGGVIAAIGAGVAAVGGIVSGIATALDSLANAVEMGETPEVVNPAIRFGLNAIKKVVFNKAERLLGGGKGSGGGYVPGRGRPLRGGRCKLVPYTAANRAKCNPNTLHHVVPDHVFKQKGPLGQRYPNTPKQSQGLAICVQGKNKNTGRDGTQISRKGFASVKEYLSKLGEHGLIHFFFDIAEAALGASGTPAGTTSLGTMENMAAREAALVTGCSPADLKKQLRDHHAGAPFHLPESARVRADPYGVLLDPPFELMGRPDQDTTHSR